MRHEAGAYIHSENYVNIEQRFEECTERVLAERHETNEDSWQDACLLPALMVAAEDVQDPDRGELQWILQWALAKSVDQ